MNDFVSWAQVFKFYEQLNVMDDINNLGSWAQDSRCYNQRKVIDDMNDSKS